PVGSDGQILSADSGTATGLRWVNRNTIIPVNTKGDVFVYSSVPDKLAVGSNGKILSADSTATSGLVWSYPTGLFDANGVLYLKSEPKVSAVNYIVISNDVTLLGPTIKA